MKMNCTTCSESIDKSKGYYLVMGVPYCTSCYQVPEETFDIMYWPPSQRREPEENLLEAFRAYQRRSQASACQIF